jgi:carboxypeptidase family protein
MRIRSAQFLSAVITVAALWIRPAEAHGQGAVGAQAPASRVLIAGQVNDSLSGTPVRGSSIEIRYSTRDSLRFVTVSDDSGRFRLSVPHQGEVRLTVRRPGYEPFGRTVEITRDTLLLSIALRRIPQPLQPVVVEQTEVDLVLREMRRELRSQNHTRIYDQRALEKSKQLLAGAFLLGQGGIMRTPCKRSAKFIPEGKVRTQPVEHEPADLFWPCTLVRGKPVSVLVSVDNGPLGEFNAVSARQLEEFAMVVVSHNNVVRAYTKLYIENRARARALERSGEKRWE